MTDSGTKAQGSCLCGAVRFTVELPALFCAHCHCSMCRRNHGAGFVTWFAVPPDRFAMDAGRDRVVRYRSSEHGTRSFCGVCGSSLLCESSEHPDRIDVVLANMDDPIGREPEFHVWFSDRVPWVSTGDSLPRLGGDSGLEPLDD